MIFLYLVKNLKSQLADDTTLFLKDQSQIPHSEGGLEVLDFKQLVSSFRISWLKKKIYGQMV